MIQDKGGLLVVQESRCCSRFDNARRLPSVVHVQANISHASFRRGVGPESEQYGSVIEQHNRRRPEGEVSPLRVINGPQADEIRTFVLRKDVATWVHIWG